MNKPDGGSSLLKAKSDALRLLSFKPRSVEEMRRRLKLKKYSDAIVQSVLETLGKQGLLDDEKFAKLYAASRIYTRPTGRRQLAFDLARQGLSKELIAGTLGNLKDYDEEAMVRELAERRLSRMSGMPAPKKKARLYVFLKRRGFGSGVILNVLSELLKEETERHCQEERSDD